MRFSSMAGPPSTLRLEARSKNRGAGSRAADTGREKMQTGRREKERAAATARAEIGKETGRRAKKGVG